ncbi:MAG: hypothetical protein ACK5XN_24735, partial [Bacteroidota bacterium]
SLERSHGHHGQHGQQLKSRAIAWPPWPTWPAAEVSSDRMATMAKKNTLGNGPEGIYAFRLSTISTILQFE